MKSYRCPHCKKKVALAGFRPGEKFTCPFCHNSHILPMNLPMEMYVKTRKPPKTSRRKPRSPAGVKTVSKKTGRTCPECGTSIPEGNWICPGCFFNLQTGRSAMRQKMKTRVNYGGIFRWIGLLVLLAGVFYMFNRYKTTCRQKAHNAKKAIDKQLNDLSESEKTPDSLKGFEKRSKENKEKIMVEAVASRMQRLKPAAGSPLVITASDGTPKAEQRKRLETRLVSMQRYKRELHEARVKALLKTVNEEKTSAESPLLPLAVLENRDRLSAGAFLELVCLKADTLFSGDKADPSQLRTFLTRMKKLDATKVEKLRRGLQSACGRKTGLPAVAVIISLEPGLWETETRWNTEQAVKYPGRMEHLQPAILDKFAETAKDFKGLPDAAALALAGVKGLFDENNNFMEQRFNKALEFIRKENR